MSVRPTFSCPNGNPDPQYSCRFCRVRLHRGDDPCGCGEHRPEVTHYATLCHECAAVLDTLGADTRLGDIHRALVREAEMRYMPSSD